MFRKIVNVLVQILTVGALVIALVSVLRGIFPPVQVFTTYNSDKDNDTD